jgi:hypothetical protein
MAMNSIGDFLEKLRNSFGTLASRLGDLQTALGNATSEEERRLAQNLNPDGAAGVAEVLDSLLVTSNQPPTIHDLIDLQTAERVSRAYLLATDWVETLDIKFQEDLIAAVHDARAEIRSQLDNIGKQDKTLLKQLVQESKTLAEQNPPTLGAIISHLTLAVDTLRQTRDNPDLIAPKISRALTENWAKILEKVEKIVVPTNEVDLQRVADLLTIRQLLDEAYDLLAEDISADSPLDVVNI